ncbi:MAG: hypothetical protein J6U93_00360 [Alistipes sp.]|nr:hypothetical protein [Alistipes sp.]
MKIQRFICAILMLGAVLATQSASAQLKTSYFMEGSYFRTDLNPALVPTRGYLALSPLSGYAYGSYSNYHSYLGYYRNGEYVDAYSPLVSANEFLGKLPNKCTMSFNYDVNLFKLGFYTLNGAFWNIGSSLRFVLDSTIPKEYYKLLKSDEPTNITAENARINSDMYLENFIGRTFRLGENITLGARLKFLVGINNAIINFNHISVADNQFSVDGNMKAAGVFYDSTNYDGEVLPEIEYGDSLESVSDHVKSFGGAIDLGAEISLFDKHLKVSGAITDLGFIKWSKETMMEGSMKASYDKKSAVENLLSIMDKDVIEMPRFFSDYTSRLVTNINLGVEYNFLHNHFSVGALSHTRILHGGIMTEFTASLNVRPTNWMSLTASHTFFNGNVPGTYGAAVNLHPRAINIFVGVDYIPTGGVIMDGVEDTLLWFSGLEGAGYLSSNSFNIYFGVGFNFGRPDFLINQQ